MIELRPAATAACSPSGAWSAMSSGQAALTAALLVPSTTVATMTAPKVGREGEDGQGRGPEHGACRDGRQRSEASRDAPPQSDGDGRAAVAEQTGQGDVADGQAQAIDVDHGDEGGRGHDPGPEEQLGAGDASHHGGAR